MARDVPSGSTLPYVLFQRAAVRLDADVYRSGRRSSSPEEIRYCDCLLIAAAADQRSESGLGK